MSAHTVRTTVALPGDLLAAADNAVRKGKARNRNELLAIALQHELAAQERVEIDAAFAAMADDTAYKSEALAITDEFRQSDWEAFRSAEESSKW